MNHRLPQGFRYAACDAGIRKKRALDLALLVSDEPASAAAVFTQNLVRAAPVTRSARHLLKSGGVARAIICNAGNANCATPTMDDTARKTAKALAKLLGARREQILIASTGVIGEPLDVDKITTHLPGLIDSLSDAGFDAASRAIMTTDTVPKTAFAEVQTDEGPVAIAGMAKGAGMIQPDMATLLSFLVTDAAIKPGLLRKMLRRAVGDSFNSISIDSDTSTNDTVFLLANGASKITPKDDDRADFQSALNKLCESLAMQIVRDGEGAKKLLTIYVEGAGSNKGAKAIARFIANSPLVKTALAGADPNWGRILPAAGRAGVRFDPNQVDIFLNGHQVCAGGMRAEFDEPTVQQTMEGVDSLLRFHIRGRGRGQARFFTCDFTEDYIKINAEYRT